MERAGDILYRVAAGVMILFGVAVLGVLIRVFAFDVFPVNTHSMEPTIVAGDKIGVNKLLFGARIYKNLDFFDGAPMQSWRVPGFRDIRLGDVVVFNHVHNRERNKLIFRFFTKSTRPNLLNSRKKSFEIFCF